MILLLDQAKQTNDKIIGSTRRYTYEQVIVQLYFYPSNLLLYIYHIGSWPNWSFSIITHESLYAIHWFHHPTIYWRQFFPCPLSLVGDKDISLQTLLPWQCMCVAQAYWGIGAYLLIGALSCQNHKCDKQLCNVGIEESCLWPCKKNSNRLCARSVHYAVTSLCDIFSRDDDNRSPLFVTTKINTIFYYQNRTLWRGFAN